MYRARPLFDLRAVDGPPCAVDEVLQGAVDETVDHDFLHVLANDCLANLPPLTFYQDAVVEDIRRARDVFRLDESALPPLVDVGRVFGMAAGAALGRLDARALRRRASALLPEHESIFREAAETLRIVLWQQGRVGHQQGHRGSNCRPRCSAVTTGTCSKAASARFSGCASSRQTRNGSKRL